MATKQDTAGITAAPTGTGGAPQGTSSDGSEINTPDQNPDAPGTSSTPSETVPKSELAKIVEKAREDEKKKLYPELDRLKREKAANDAKLAELTTKLESQTKEVEGLRTGTVQEKDSVNRELRELREHIAKQEKALEAVAEDAASRIRASEIESYREKALRKSGIKHLADLVSGGSEADIDASIERAQKKEKAVLDAAETEARKKLADTLPTPIAPAGDLGRGPSGINPNDKHHYAAMKGPEYAKVRAQLMADARKKAGLS